MCALAHAEGDSTLTLQGLVSRPYLQMTMEVLEDMGIEITILNEDEDNRSMAIHVPGNQRANAMDVAIDGDWSAAAFLLALGALCAPHHLNVEGLHSTYTQADEAVKGALLFGGCRLAGTDEGVQILAGKPKSFHVDLTDCPDLFPPTRGVGGICQKAEHLSRIASLGQQRIRPWKGHPRRMGQSGHPSGFE